MATVRDKFHELGNWHNKISMAAITARESLQATKQLSSSELSEAVEKAIKILNKIEGYVQSTDQVVSLIKPFVYEKIGADVKVYPKDKLEGGSTA